MSETATLTVTTFILARVSEDEATARYATTRGNPTDQDFAGWWLGHYDHAQRHSPARVLAECEAKRRIVELHQYFVMPHGNVRSSVQTLHALAAIYSDHPDYREEWRPPA